jgi:putative membrane protein
MVYSPATALILDIGGRVRLAANVMVGLVAAIHLYFLVLEMFLWDTPTGHRTFGLEPAFAAESKTLAANQGLYNGFLAAGLVWGLVTDRTDVELFFLGCVVLAGAYGAVTVNRRILVVQALPALVGFVLVLLAG